jgi:hypothetical protein
VDDDIYLDRESGGPTGRFELCLGYFWESAGRICRAGWIARAKVIAGRAIIQPHKIVSNDTLPLDFALYRREPNAGGHA